MNNNNLVIRRLDRLIELHEVLVRSIERWEGKDEYYHKRQLDGD